MRRGDHVGAGRADGQAVRCSPVLPASKEQRQGYMGNLHHSWAGKSNHLMGGTFAVATVHLVGKVNQITSWEEYLLRLRDRRTANRLQTGLPAAWGPNSSEGQPLRMGSMQSLTQTRLSRLLHGFRGDFPTWLWIFTGNRKRLDMDPHLNAIEIRTFPAKRRMRR